MKGFACSVFIMVGIMLVSCAFNSLAMWLGLVQSMPPSYIGSDVKEPAETPILSRKEDFQYPDFGIRDQESDSRSPNGYASRVVDHGPQTQAEFPPNW